MSRKFTYLPQGGFIDEGYNPYLLGGKLDVSKFLEKPKRKSARSMSRSRSKSRGRGGMARSQSRASRSQSRSRSRSRSQSRSRSMSRGRGGTNLGGKSLLSAASAALKGQVFKSKADRGKAVAKLVKKFKSGMY